MDSENRATFVKQPYITYIRPARRQQRSCEGCYSLGHMARASPDKEGVRRPDHASATQSQSCGAATSLPAAT